MVIIMMNLIKKELEYYKEQLVGKRYRHFKGNTYVVTGIAINCETEELMVIYKNYHDPSLVWVRTLKEFLSKVDKEKYPDIKQKLRFEPLI